MEHKAGVRHQEQSLRKVFTVEDEEIFKAERIHRFWLDGRRRDGFHLPSYHVSAFSVAPPLGDDGKTYCLRCDVSMVPWIQVSGNTRTNRISEARQHMAIQRAWEESQR